jgi:hypothetical protein
MYTYLHIIKYYNQKNIIKTSRIDSFPFPENAAQMVLDTRKIHQTFFVVHEISYKKMPGIICLPATAQEIEVT